MRTLAILLTLATPISAAQLFDLPGVEFRNVTTGGGDRVNAFGSDVAMHDADPNNGYTVGFSDRESGFAEMNFEVTFPEPVLLDEIGFFGQIAAVTYGDGDRHHRGWDISIDAILTDGTRETVYENKQDDFQAVARTNSLPFLNPNVRFLNLANVDRVYLNMRVEAGARHEDEFDSAGGSFTIQNFKAQGEPMSAASAVPEPATWLLAMLGLPLLFRKRLR